MSREYEVTVALESREPFAMCRGSLDSQVGLGFWLPSARNRRYYERRMEGESELLLIEENPHDAAEVMEGLRAHGIQQAVKHLHSVADAQKFFQSNSSCLPPAAIVSLGMEPRHGYELIRWIRRDPGHHTLVLIALGTLGRMREVQEAYAAGANAYFIKGSDYAAIARTLRSVLAAREAERLSAESLATHPAFRSSPHLYEARGHADNRGMANPAPLLLVEENEGHAKIFAQTIEALKSRNPLRRVKSVDEAISYLAGKAPFEDRAANRFPIALFVDIRLAESHRLLAWLEAHPESKPAGLIALTSSHDMRPVIQAYHLGVHSFLKEPPKLEELRNALSAIPRTQFCEKEGAVWLQEIT
jgi:DNA-binding NarL/FixJ family response regulator